MLKGICLLFGYKWDFVGGRPCPKGGEKCSQSVYRCKRCGKWDYGYPGGPEDRDAVSSAIC